MKFNKLLAIILFIILVFIPSCCLCSSGQYCVESNGEYQCRSYGGQINTIKRAAMTATYNRPTISHSYMCTN